MNDDLSRIWKEATVALFKVLFRHLLRGTDEYHVESQTRGRSLCRYLKPDFPNTKLCHDAQLPGRLHPRPLASTVTRGVVTLLLFHLRRDVERIFGLQLSLRVLFRGSNKFP